MTVRTFNNSRPPGSHRNCWRSTPTNAALRAHKAAAALSVLFVVAAVAGLSLWIAPAEASPAYPWLPQSGEQRTQARIETLSQRFAPPAGFRRIELKPDTFGVWLRRLPMKPAQSRVMLHTGSPKWRQDVHAGVIDIDTGKRDLQQCADAAMRLRAEWLWEAGRKDEIGFNYTGGGRVSFSRWARGERPSEDGKRWTRRGKADGSYASFRRYMIQVFAYAGTYSLSKELKPVAKDDLTAGDIFIVGGFPGHAVLVVDVALNPDTGEKVFLLAQSFMPAQDMHVLVNPADKGLSPWYRASFGWPLQTPEWSFPEGSLKRWP